MRAFLVASIGGLAALLVMYWCLVSSPTKLQEETVSSVISNATPGNATRLLPGVLAVGPASGAGTRDREARNIQALVDRILSRPLFNADRRPGTVPNNGPAGLPRLTAVLVSSTVKTVIFAAGADGKPIALAEGGQIGNYVVRSIDAGQVTVVGPNGIQVIRPTHDSTTPPPIAARSMVDLMRQNVPATGILALPLPAQQ